MQKVGQFHMMNMGKDVKKLQRMRILASFYSKQFYLFHFLTD